MAYPFDVATFNLINFSQKMPDLTDSTPKMVELPVMNEDGSITTRQVQNLGMMKSDLQSVLESAADSNIYNFYVDQANGDDTNPGTSDAPFKSLTKAFSILKPYSYNTINIEGDYIEENTLNSYTYIYIRNTNVNLNVKGKLSIPYKQVNEKNTLAFQFFVSNSIFNINVYSSLNGVLEIATSGENTNNDYSKYYGTSLILSNGMGNKISCIFKNYEDNSTILKIGNYANLLYIGKDTFAEMMFCCSGTGRESVMGTESALIVNARKLFLSCTYNQLGWKDAAGNATNLQDYLIGFNKDANGIPLNYMVTPNDLI